MAFELLSRRNVKHEPVLALPFGGTIDGRSVTGWSEIAIFSSQYSQWATDAKITLINGYSGQRTKLQFELARVMSSFPSSESFEYLERICGLRWIIVAPSLSPSWNEESFMRRLEELSAYTSEVEVSADKSILIKLADRPIPIPLESAPESLVFFAPAHVTPHIKLAPIEPSQAMSACMITTEIPTKSGTSERGTFKLTEVGFDGIAPSYDSSRTPGSPLAKRTLASPNLLRIFASGCAPLVSCGTR
jgi:hypothetical protein